MLDARYNAPPVLFVAVIVEVCPAVNETLVWLSVIEFVPEETVMYGHVTEVERCPFTVT